MPSTEQKSVGIDQVQNTDTTLPQTENSQPKKSAKKLPPIEPWLVIGTLKYGTRKTENELKRRAARMLKLPWIYGDQNIMAKKKILTYYDYKLVIHTADIMHALDVSERQAQRLLQETRQHLKKDKKHYVTVLEFCHLHKLDEPSIRKKIVRPPKE